MSAFEPFIIEPVPDDEVGYAQIRKGDKHTGSLTLGEVFEEVLALMRPNIRRPLGMKTDEDWDIRRGKREPFTEPLAVVAERDKLRRQNALLVAVMKAVQSALTEDDGDVDLLIESAIKIVESKPWP